MGMAGGLLDAISSAVTSRRVCHTDIACPPRPTPSHGLARARPHRGGATCVPTGAPISCERRPPRWVSRSAVGRATSRSAVPAARDLPGCDERTIVSRNGRLPDPGRRPRGARLLCHATTHAPGRTNRRHGDGRSQTGLVRMAGRAIAGKSPRPRRCVAIASFPRAEGFGGPHSPHPVAHHGAQSADAHPPPFRHHGPHRRGRACCRCGRSSGRRGCRRHDALAARRPALGGRRGASQPHPRGGRCGVGAERRRHRSSAVGGPRPRPADRLLLPDRRQLEWLHAVNPSPCHRHVSSVMPRLSLSPHLLPSPSHAPHACRQTSSATWRLTCSASYYRTGEAPSHAQQCTRMHDVHRARTASTFMSVCLQVPGR